MSPSSLKPLSKSVISKAFITKPASEKSRSAYREQDDENQSFPIPKRSRSPRSSSNLLLLPFVNTAVIAFLLILVVLRVNGKPLTTSSFGWKDCEFDTIYIYPTLFFFHLQSCPFTDISLHRWLSYFSGRF